MSVFLALPLARGAPAAPGRKEKGTCLLVCREVGKAYDLLASLYRAERCQSDRAFCMPVRSLSIVVALLAYVPCCICLPVNQRRQTSIEARDTDGGLLQVEPALANPAEVLACLRRHRSTALACNHMANQTSQPSSQPSADICGGSVRCSADGVCAYTMSLGWHCRCAPRSKEVTRGHEASLNHQPVRADCVYS